MFYNQGYLQPGVLHPWARGLIIKGVTRFLEFRGLTVRNVISSGLTFRVLTSSDLTFRTLTSGLKVGSEVALEPGD